MQYRRIHSDGIDAMIEEESSRWRIQISFRQKGKPPRSLVGLHAPTLREAQQLADSFLRGHVCNANCKNWKLVNPA
jgi:hypothetical protein